MNKELENDLTLLLVNLFGEKVMPHQIDCASSLRRTMYELSDKSRVLSPLFVQALEQTLVKHSNNPFGTLRSKVAQASRHQQIDMFVSRLYDKDIAAETDQKDFRQISTLNSALFICKVKDKNIDIETISRIEMESILLEAVQSLVPHARSEALMELNVLLFRQFKDNVNMHASYPFAFISEFFNIVYGTKKAMPKKSTNYKLAVSSAFSFCAGVALTFILIGI